MIAGFEKPDSGRIELDGRDVAGDPPNRRPVNTVFQTYALFPFMTVWDNVAFGLRYQKATKDETKRRVGEALDLVQMGKFAKRRPAQLSGGQQQRVALARALVLRPTRAAARRAAGCLGCQAAQAVTARTAGRPARGGHHVRLRDPRPGRGAHHERPDRRARRGTRRADRPSAGDLLGACHHVRGEFPRRGQHLRRRRARAVRIVGRLLGDGHQARCRRGRDHSHRSCGHRDQARADRLAGRGYAGEQRAQRDQRHRVRSGLPRLVAPRCTSTSARRPR